MSSEYLSQNDRHLAKALFTVWRHSPNQKDVAEGLKTYDRLQALEMRTRGSAGYYIKILVAILSQHGLKSHSRWGEMEEVIKDYPDELPSLEAAEKDEESDSLVMTPPAAGIGVKNIPMLIQSVDSILADDTESPWETTDKHNQCIEDYSASSSAENFPLVSPKIQRLKLPWFEDVYLVRIFDKSWYERSLVVYYLAQGESPIYRLAGKSDVIHKINAEASININESNFIDYLNFFCYFVRGDEGPFYIIESIEDPLTKKLINEQLSKQIEPVISKIKYKGRNRSGHFLCDVSVFYSNAIFNSLMAVHKTGMVEMLNDNPRLADLPIRIDYPLSIEDKKDLTTKEKSQSDDQEIVVTPPLASGREIRYRRLIQSISEVLADSKSGPWTDVDGNMLKEVVEEYRKYRSSRKAKLNIPMISRTQLPWYKDTDLIRLFDPSWENLNLVVYFIKHKNAPLTRLLGESATIHSLNSQAAINISDRNVIDYLIFFCYFIRSKHFAFHFIESPDDPFLDGSLKEYEDNKIREMINPIEYKGKNKEGEFRCNGTLAHGDAMFKAEFTIAESGEVRMLSDERFDFKLSRPLSYPLELKSKLWFWRKN